MGENEVVMLKWAKVLLEKKPNQSITMGDYEVLVSPDLVEVITDNTDVVTIVPDQNLVKYHPQMEKSSDLRALIKKSLKDLAPPVYETVEAEIYGAGLELLSPMPFRKDVDNFKVCVRSEVIEVLRTGNAYATVYPTLKVCRLHSSFATLEKVREVLTKVS